MTPDAAIAFADQHFPEGPEKLAALLQVDVRRAVVKGCDGWCLTYQGRTIIRIDVSRSQTSQRFTLAHELGHLLLGIPSIVGESMAETLSSNSSEERQVNALAAELLLPRRIVVQHVSKLPIVSKSISKLAKVANVSELATTIRIVNLAQEIGLENAAVAHFRNDVLQWIWSNGLIVPESALPSFLADARNAHPLALRRTQSDGKVAVASLIDNPKFASTNLFLQLLPPERVISHTPHERRVILEAILFSGSCTYRNQLQGILGSLKHRRSWSGPDEAERDFWSRHNATFKATSLNSEEGREYIHLRINEWFG